METLSPYAVDGMLPLLFKQFEEHRWQTKLAAVNNSSTAANLPLGRFPAFQVGNSSADVLGARAATQPPELHLETSHSSLS